MAQLTGNQRGAVRERAARRRRAPHPAVPPLACPRPPWPTTARSGRLPSACPGVRATRGGGCSGPGGRCPLGGPPWVAGLCPPPPVLPRSPPGVRAALHGASAVAVARRSLCHLRRRPGPWVTAEGGCPPRAHWRASGRGGVCARARRVTARWRKILPSVFIRGPVMHRGVFLPTSVVQN